MTGRKVTVFAPLDQGGREGGRGDLPYRWTGTRLKGTCPVRSLFWVGRFLEHAQPVVSGEKWAGVRNRSGGVSCDWEIRGGQYGRVKTGGCEQLGMVRGTRDQGA